MWKCTTCEAAVPIDCECNCNLIPKLTDQQRIDVLVSALQEKDDRIRALEADLAAVRESKRAELRTSEECHEDALRRLAAALSSISKD